MDDLSSGSPTTRHSPFGRLLPRLVDTGRSWIRLWVRSPRVRAALTTALVAAALILLLARADSAAFFAARDVLFPPVLPTPTPTAILTPDPAETLRQRPLRVPLLAHGSPCPTVLGRTLDPALIAVVGDGPVYVALGSADILGYAPASNFGSQEWGGQKTIWAVQPGFTGSVLVRGHQVDGPNEVRFGSGDVPETDLLFDAPSKAAPAPPNGWTYEIDYTRVHAPGCYAYQIDGETFSDVIIFQAQPEAPK